VLLLRADPEFGALMSAEAADHALAVLSDASKLRYRKPGMILGWVPGKWGRSYGRLQTF